MRSINLGILLMVLSSIAGASDNLSTPKSTGDLSRSPFKVDRDKTQTKTELPGHSQSVFSDGQRDIYVPSASAQNASQSATARAYNPWLTLNLQENHLLSQDIDVWAKSQGMRILWNSNRDYLIYSTIHLTGKSRDEVLNQLGQLFRSENYGLVVKLYEKNNVLVIDGQ